MLTVKGKIRCYRCDATVDVDLEVEPISIGSTRGDGFLVKSPSESDVEGWAEITDPYSYGSSDREHWYCPKHWKNTKDWPGKEAIYR